MGIIYALMWFFLGAVVCKFISKVTLSGKVLMMFDRVHIISLEMLSAVHDDTKTLLQSRYHRMSLHEYTDEQIAEIEATDDFLLKVWRDASIVHLRLKAPQELYWLMDYTSWNEAMNFLDKQKKDFNEKSKF